ncbi:unnamed protein product [Dicrocoelium dendriticum]|nr:unnamed protein product [Dicrocoelium dendriticum]
MMTEDLFRPEAACLPAGRYEFKDSGIYIGEWLNEKAVGLGLITKDKCQGEYTGLWDAGMEKSGVFLWPNAPGAMYEGEWANNRRNGHGVFTREDWVIKGKFSEDFISIGIKCKENSIGRFEGEFENGFPSFGVETYADGGSYAGEYKNGIREGLGVRTSIPYGEVINFFPEEAALAAEMALKAKRVGSPPGLERGRLTRQGSLFSQRSGDNAEVENGELLDDDDDYDEDELYINRKQTPNTASPTGGGMRDLRMSTKFRCGFVLSSQRSELIQRRQLKLVGAKVSRKSRDRSNRSGHTRARSLTNLFHRSASRESIPRVKRQGSASERSTRKAQHEATAESVFNLDLDDAIDPETIETFAGQWGGDFRHGYGVCERSDGVTYEGQWFKNQRHGYGQTHFQDGTCEQGRYHYGRLVFLAWQKGTKPHLLLYNYHIKMEVAGAVKRARVIAEQARMRANEATENLENVNTAVDKAQRAAELAREYSLETRELVKEMYPDFEQPGIKYLDDMVRLMRVTKHGNQAFESALQAAQDVLAGVTSGAAADQDGATEKSPKQKHQTSNSLDLPQESGSPISRAGSYRARRKSRHHSQHEKRQRDPESGQHVPIKDHTNEFPFQYGSNADYPTGMQPLTLTVPKINYDLNASPQLSSALADGSVHRDKANGRPREPAHTMFLDVPDRHGTHGWDDLNDDDSEMDHTDGDQFRITRSPSVATTYVTIPCVTDLHPESEIPSVPLSKLISNANLMHDHFSHYANVTSANSPKLSTPSPSPVEPGGHSPNLSPELEMRERMQQYTGTETEETGTHSGLCRRRTVPAFLTQRPILPNGKQTSSRASQPNKKNVHQHQLSQTNGFPPPNSMEIQPSTPTSLIGSKRIGAQPGILVDRNRVCLGLAARELLLEKDDDEEEEEFVIYLVDEGVRKRVHAEPNYKKPKEKCQAPVIEQQQAVVMNAIEEGPKLLALTYGESSPEIATKQTTVEEPTSSSPKQPMVVGNVMLEDVQDELVPLTTHFRESRLDVRQTGARYSVPNVSEHQIHTIPPGLSPEELSQLSRESETKRAEEWARRQQGEIVIHLTDLWDWCSRNFVTFIILLINGTLAYLFAMLVYEGEKDER